MVTSESNFLAWTCRSSTVTAVRGLAGAQYGGTLRLTSNLWELLVQQPEVLSEGILSIVLGNLVRLAQEEVLPIPFELFEERLQSWFGQNMRTPTCSFMTFSRSCLTLRSLIFSNT